jgi:hypothetical protein
MLSAVELLDAIEELQNTATTYQDCQKLATFLTLYDKLYGSEPERITETTRATILEEYGETEFYQAIKGKEAEKVLRILNETMEALQILQPRLYTSALTELIEAGTI